MYKSDKCTFGRTLPVRVAHNNNMLLHYIFLLAVIISELKTISETTPLPHKEIDQAQFVVIGSQKLTNQQELLKLYGKQVFSKYK